MKFNFCPSCGFKLEGDFKFCPNCGFSLINNDEEDLDDIDLDIDEDDDLDDIDIDMDFEDIEDDEDDDLDDIDIDIDPEDIEDDEDVVDPAIREVEKLIEVGRLNAARKKVNALLKKDDNEYLEILYALSLNDKCHYSSYFKTYESDYFEKHECWVLHYYFNAKHYLFRYNTRFDNEDDEDMAMFYCEKLLGEYDKHGNESTFNQYIFATIFLDSMPIYEDYDEAEKLLLAASDKGDYAPAQYLLANEYYSGKKLAKNIDKAVKYWTIAADKHNHAMAQYALSQYYHDEGNNSKYLSYLKKAADQECFGAMRELLELYQTHELSASAITITQLEKRIEEINEEEESN